MDTKVCAICKEEKGREEFCKSTQRKDGLGSYCRPCDNKRKLEWKSRNKEKCKTYSREYSRQYRKDNPEKVRAQKKKDESARRLRRFGLTQEQYDLIDTGKCHLCGTPHGGKIPHIDHCHSSMEVRGILCHYCNTGLGLFKDDPNRLKKAIIYLEERKDGYDNRDRGQGEER